MCKGIATPYQWTGGSEAFEQATRAFYAQVCGGEPIDLLDAGDVDEVGPDDAELAAAWSSRNET